MTRLGLQGKLVIVCLVLAIAGSTFLQYVRADIVPQTFKDAAEDVGWGVLELGQNLEEKIAWWDTAEAKSYLTTFGALTFFAQLTDDAARKEAFNNPQINEGIEAGNRFLLNLINLFYILVLLLT